MFRCQHRNLSRHGGQTRRFYRWLQTYNRHITPTLAQRSHSSRSSRIAPNDYHLNALIYKALDSSNSEALYLATLTPTIWAVLAVTEIYNRLIWKQSTQLTPHRQASKT
jgi:hypothetical protein